MTTRRNQGQRGGAKKTVDIEEAPSIDLTEPEIEKITEDDIDLALFMEDQLTISTVDKREDQGDSVPVCVNGKYFEVPLGKVSVVPRYVVERLIRMRTVQVAPRNITLDMAVKNDNVPYTQHHVQEVIFQVIDDPRGDYGRKWVQQIYRQP